MIEGANRQTGVTVQFEDNVSRQRDRRRRGPRQRPRAAARSTCAAYPPSTPLQLGDSSTVRVGDPDARDRQPVRARPHADERDRVGAPAPDRGAQRVQHRQRDPDRRADQPRQLGRTAARRRRARDRDQLADRHRRTRGPTAASESPSRCRSTPPRRSCPGSSTASRQARVPGARRRERPRQAQRRARPDRDRAARRRAPGSSAATRSSRSTADRVVVDGRAPVDPRHPPARSDGRPFGRPRERITSGTFTVTARKPARNSRLSRRRRPRLAAPTMWVMEAGAPKIKFCGITSLAGRRARGRRRRVGGRHDLLAALAAPLRARRSPPRSPPRCKRRVEIAGVFVNPTSTSSRGPPTRSV